MGCRRRSWLIGSLMPVRFSIPLCLARVYTEKWGMCCIGDHVTNLREDILIYRLKYSLASMDEAKEEDFLGKAVKALEK